jgi:exopolysaccharide biosynthesis polyprenyl glycosylphosphotransferase
MAVPRTIQRVNPLRLRVGERRILLLAGDLFVALIALGIALYFWALQDQFFGPTRAFFEKRPPGWYFLLPLFWILLLVELYDTKRAGSRRETLRGVGMAVLIGLGLYLLVYFSSPPRSLPRQSVLTFILAAAGLTIAWRFLFIRIFMQTQFMRRVLLVGGGKAGAELLTITGELWPPPFDVVGIVDDDPEKQGIKLVGHNIMGGSDRLLDLVMEHRVSDIIVAISGEMKGRMFQALLDAQECGVEIIRMPKAYEELVGRVPIRLLEADWILRSFVDEARVSIFYELGKRLVDLLGGLVGSLILLLLLPFITLATLIDSGRPIFYSQIRSGRGAQPYKILKFRTMRQDAEADGKPQWAKEDDERATRVGRLLRKTHIDELPQFLNVLRGEMSLVGPRAERPELVEMFQKHVPFYRARLLVKPGMTGWAQINFPYASTIDETVNKLEYDLYYIKHRSLTMDMLIMLRTPSTVFGFRGR